MPVAEQSKSFVNFTAGLNTEATPLNFPENAAQELDNFDLHKSGKVTRRLGLDFENSYALSSTSWTDATLQNLATSQTDWRSVNGKGDINFTVIQVGMKLFFHEFGSEPTSGNMLGSVDLSTYRTQSDADRHVMQTAFGLGRMVVTNPGMDVVSINYDEDKGTFTPSKVTIQIRDFKGLDDELETDERPTTLSKKHRYNLMNQGWPKTATVSLSRGGSDGVAQNIDPVAECLVLVGYYPSNADQFHNCRAVAAKSGKEEVIGAFSAFLLTDVQLGNTPAPKGHFVIDYFSQDRATAAGTYPGPYNKGQAYFTTADFGVQQTSARPSGCAFYAGRMWYFGVKDKNYVGDCLFSQLIENDDDLGKCYQDQDPTAEDVNNVLATDGGVIHIADMGEFHRAVVMGQDLVIVAANGVWAISGTQGGNFKASDYTVRKLTDQGSVAPDAVVVAEGSVFWWSRGGIWRVVTGQISDQFEVTRITLNTIQSFYTDISGLSRAYCRGYFDEFNKKINWLYNDDDSYDGISYRYKYNRALVLDLALPAFYTYTFSSLDTHSPWISGMGIKFPGSQTTQTYNIRVNGSTLGLSSDNIVESIDFPVFADNKIKYLTFVPNADGEITYTFSEQTSREFLDWSTWDTYINNATSPGADYTSVIQAGWQDYASPLTLKHITHITSYFERTETGYTLDGDQIVYDYPSGGTVQVRWEYTDQDVGRWTAQQVAYRLLRMYIPADENDPFDYGFTTIQTKLRVRGKGHAFSARYESESGKDMRLLGFAVNVRAGTKL